MPSVELDQSPHAPGVSPVRIFYREFGRGRPLLFCMGDGDTKSIPSITKLRSLRKIGGS